MASCRQASRPAEARQELARLRVDIAVLVGWNKRGLLTCWTHQRFWALVCYRLERAAFLLCGRGWPVLEPLVKIALALIRPPTVEISYRARIGAGLAIYHPSLGIVVAPETEAGDRLVLVGGNCIGIRLGFAPDDPLVLGDRVILGANAVVLGPVRVGDDVWVGAGTVVTRDAPDGAVVRGPSANVSVSPEQWHPSPSGRAPDQAAVKPNVS